MSNEPSSIIAVVITFILGLFSSCEVPLPNIVNTSDVALEMVFSLDAETTTAEVLDSTVVILEERLGTSVISVNVVEATRILLALPASDFEEQERIIRLATQQGKLSFHLVKDEVMSQDLISQDLEEAVFTESIISQATVQPDSLGQPSVYFEVHPNYQEALGELTQNNTGRRLAIVLDGDVLIAPTIQGRLSEGGVISGGNTLEESQDLADVLSSGSLPHPLIFEQVRSVE